MQFIALFFPVANKLYFFFTALANYLIHSYFSLSFSLMDLYQMQVLTAIQSDILHS